MDRRAIVEWLGRSAFFGVLTEVDRAAIAGRMRRVQFRPDQIMFSQGDPARDIYLVLQGRVRLSVLSSDGRELSFDHATAGDIFGEIAALDGGNRTASAIAISHGEAMTLAHDVLQRLIDSDSRVATAMIRLLCKYLRQTNRALEAIALHSIEVRIARTILAALRLRSPASGAGTVPLDLGMSQGELALLIGASRPKVNVALTALEQAGAITRAGTTLLCNTAILEHVAME